MAFYLNDTGMYEDLALGQDEGIVWMAASKVKYFSVKNLYIRKSLGAVLPCLDGRWCLDFYWSI